MVERVFLGWDEPFLEPAVRWLLDRGDELPHLLVLVPTTQSSRRLRERMAEVAGAILSPRIVTPGSLLHDAAADAAPNWIEQVAWAEVLDGVADWSEYEALFPIAPVADAEWSASFARELSTLQSALQENGHTLASTAASLAHTTEADRWSALARLEKLFDTKLASWSLRSKSSLLAKGVRWPTDRSHIVLAGVPEVPPLIERALRHSKLPVTVLLGAPASMQEGFSDVGRPLTTSDDRKPVAIDWNTMPMPDPTTLAVTADPRQQAQEAVRIVADQKTPSSELAIGSPDSAVAVELARAFTAAGWPTFLPVTDTIPRGLTRWLGLWNKWLGDPKLSLLADLLALPETTPLIGGRRAQKARSLARFRDQNLPPRVVDMERQVTTATFRNEVEKAAAEEALNAAKSLESWRDACLGSHFASAFAKLLEKLSTAGPATAASAELLMAWLDEAAPLMQHVKRPAVFWLGLMLDVLPPDPPQPPEDRALDVQGWLELYHEPGRHLVLCGMNEGSIPSRGGNEAWLGQAARIPLGLLTDADRAARDAFCYRSMVEARRRNGRVDVLCGKSGGTGDVLLPSRLLLSVPRDALPARIENLFRKIEPPDAGLRWQADFAWKSPHVAPPQSLGISTLGRYLQCPFRFYLENVLKMRLPEPDRIEWNQRDYGNIAHAVLERWGLDPEAREFEKTEILLDWFSREIDREIEARFGKRPPLAVRIQTESLRNRMAEVARHQACARAEGWEIIEVERDVSLELNGLKFSGRIDRVDRHRETGQLRVIDYKTGSKKGVAGEHRSSVTGTFKPRPHWDETCPAIYETVENDKPQRFYWTDLQLPLYAATLLDRGAGLPVPCYFLIPEADSSAGLFEWTGFNETDAEAAMRCAAWIAGQVAAGVFWPPAESVKYDNIQQLTAGRPLTEGFEAV